MELQWQVSLNVIARACNPVSWAVQCPAFNKHREKKTQNLRLQSLSVLVNHCVPEFICVLSTQYFARSARNARIYIFIKLTLLKGLVCSFAQVMVATWFVPLQWISSVIRLSFGFFGHFSTQKPLVNQTYCVYTQTQMALNTNAKSSCSYIEMCHTASVCTQTAERQEEAVNYGSLLTATWWVASWLMTLSNVTSNWHWRTTRCGRSAHRGRRLDVAPLSSSQTPRSVWLTCRVRHQRPHSHSVSSWG